jgi:two-component system, chemotaxis family, chemotaxis protein CheY
MPKVMVVDDSLFMLEHISKLLRKRGYDSVTAMNGYDAVRLYEEDSPDVVLMDVTMPGRDGLEALFEIKQLDSTAKVIMLTALNQEWLVTEAMNLGAKDFLTKPVSPDRLISALERVIGYGR